MDQPENLCDEAELMPLVAAVQTLTLDPAVAATAWRSVGKDRDEVLCELLAAIEGVGILAWIDGECELTVDSLRADLESTPSFPQRLTWDWVDAAIAEGDCDDLATELGARCLEEGVAAVGFMAEDFDAETAGWGVVFMDLERADTFLRHFTQAGHSAVILGRSVWQARYRAVADINRVADAIDLLVDEQLDRGGAHTGFDIECPHSWCGQPWHGLPITAEQERASTRDTAPILCPGSLSEGAFIPPRPEPVPQVENSSVGGSSGVAARVGLRVVMVALACLSFGFLAWGLLLRLALVTGRRRDWVLCWLVIAVHVLIWTLLSMDSGEEISTWQGELGMYLLFGTLIVTTAYYLVADIWWYRTSARW
ncbi:hypothetical protein ACFWF3_05420 [Nocardia sp. NPDC060220]|uniref:hypothetical protein n=1 Tax=Nocardia sp. NPDC060220 TaxID=3347076 RepID=UPI00365EDFE6